MSSPAKKLFPPTTGMRDLVVDVQDGQANIVEFVAVGNGSIQIRRLREQNLTQAARMELDKLKRDIVYGHEHGGYHRSGLYRPQNETVGRRMTEIAQELERGDGAEAWDRRRVPR